MACTKEQIAECLRAERARRNWSREYVAQEINISASTLGTYENAECRITLDVAWRLADLYELPIGKLVGRDESAFAPVN